MDIEDIIKEKRGLEYALKRKYDNKIYILLQQLINEYYMNIDICEHDNYIDEGYYKYHNGDICKVVKDNAEFRILKCSECGKKITLLKTKDLNWDNQIFDKKLNINNNKEDFDLLMYSYFNLKQKYCGHIQFINNGYYLVEDNHIKKKNYDECDFRAVTCTKCQKQYLLPKDEDKNWNAKINGEPITVLHGRQKIKAI